MKTAENVKKWKKNFWSYSFSLILFHFVFQNRKKEGRKEKRTHKSKGSIGRGRRWITSFLKCFYFLIYVLHFWLFCFIVHRHLGFDGDANSDYFYNQTLIVLSRYFHELWFGDFLSFLNVNEKSDWKLFPLHSHSWSRSAFQLLGMWVDIEGTWNFSPRMAVYKLALYVWAPKKNCFKSVN